MLESDHFIKHEEIDLVPFKFDMSNVCKTGVLVIVFFGIFLVLVQLTNIYSYSKNDDIFDIGERNINKISEESINTLSTQTYSYSTQNNEEDDESTESPTDEAGINSTYVRWLGLDVSPENPFFKLVDKREYAKIDCEKLQRFQVDKWEKSLLKYYKEWIPKVGFNNIINCIAQKNVSISSIQLHHLGEVLVEYANTEYEEVDPKLLIEVATANQLHFAPLHGIVWSLIDNYGIKNTDEFYSYVRDLCWFQDVDGGGKAWTSCNYFYLFLNSFY